MKKIIAISLFLITLITSIGCSAKLNPEHKEILSIVGEMERLEHLLLDFKIPYKEYKEATDPFLAPGYTNKEDKVVFGYDGTLYMGKDLIEVTTEKMMIIQTNIEKEFNETRGKRTAISIGLSNVFTNESMNWKYVITKEVAEYDKYPSLITYKKYTFKNVDKAWKIMNITSASAYEDTLPKQYIEQYEKHNGETINFTMLKIE